MVEVFKTNIQEIEQAKMISDILSKRFPYHKINFDLEDCDKILRISGDFIEMSEITLIITQKGFACQELLD